MKGYSVGIAEFTPVTIGDVKERLLDKPEAALGVIRDAVAPAYYRSAPDFQADADLPCDAGQFAVFQDLQAVVEAWMAEQSAVGQLVEIGQNITAASVARAGSVLHIDNERPGQGLRLGPLSASLRIDSSQGQRYFCGTRPNFALITADGQPDVDALERHNRTLSQQSRLGHWTVERACPDALAIVEQHPGDIILIPNWPTYSVHGIYADLGTEAAIYDYHIAAPE